jgi:hypothetical protein
MKYQSLSTLAKLAFGVAMLAAPAVKASDFLFHVDLNTTALKSAANGPFTLDFQLNQGGGTLSNTVTLRNFLFAGTGAGPANETPFTFGNASGDLGSSITLVDSKANPFNEISQGFTAGTTDIQFDVDITGNYSGTTPDQFLVAIQDGNYAYLPTSATDQQSLVTMDISANNQIVVGTSTTTTVPTGVVTATVVPEPSSFVAMISSLGMLLGLRRRRA